MNKDERIKEILEENAFVTSYANFVFHLFK